MNTKTMFSSRNDTWETPQDFFDKLDDIFHFDIDVCATADNAKCSVYYTPEDDGLQKNMEGHMLVQSDVRQKHKGMDKKGV